MEKLKPCALTCCCPQWVLALCMVVRGWVPSAAAPGKQWLPLGRLAKTVPCCGWQRGPSSAAYKLEHSSSSISHFWAATLFDNILLFKLKLFCWCLLQTNVCIFLNKTNTGLILFCLDRGSLQFCLCSREASHRFIFTGISCEVFYSPFHCFSSGILSLGWTYSLVSQLLFWLFPYSTTL